MNKKLLIPVIAIIGILGLLQISGTFSLADQIGEASCDWQDLQVDGNTFTSIEEVQEQYPEGYQQLTEVGDIRVQDGIVQYRLSGCGTGDFQ